MMFLLSAKSLWIYHEYSTLNAITNISILMPLKDKDCKISLMIKSGKSFILPA